jgi:putative toxin-antitoxin system antitoxin component (TIGR02293 family)
MSKTTTLSNKNKLNANLNKEVLRLMNLSEFKSNKTASNKDISYQEFIKNKMLIVYAIRTGIPYTFFEQIQAHTPFTENDWIVFLDLSSKSLQRYKAETSHTFKPSHTEKIFEVAEVSEYGLETFGSMDKFKLWLQTPNYSLGKLTPMELLKDSYGKEMVMAELTRINYGILA